MSDLESMLELLKPENWGYLAGLIGLMAFIQWWTGRRARNKNKSLNIDTDVLPVEDIARAWTTGHIKKGAHKDVLVVVLLFLALVIGLALVALEQYLLGLIAMVSVIVLLLIQVQKLKVVDLLALDEDRFQELKEYYADNRETLVADALKDKEVIETMEKWPSWIRKYNLRATKFKNFRPMRNPND